MMSLRRLKVTRCNILGANLHIKIERSQGPKPVGILHLSRGRKTCQKERGNRNYRDKRPKGSTDRGQKQLRYLKDLLKVKGLKTFEGLKKNKNSVNDILSN